MVPEKPEPSAQQETGNNQDPDRRGRLAIHLSSPVGVVRRHSGPHRVGHIVGPVRDGHQHRAGYLRIGPEVLDAVIVARGGRVDGGQLLGLEGHAVPRDALEQPEFAETQQSLGVDEGEVAIWREEAVFGLDGLGAPTAEFRGHGALLEGAGVAVWGVGGIFVFGVLGIDDGRVVLRCEFGGHGACVVVDDDVCVLGGEIDEGIGLPEGGPEGDVPPFQAGVFFDEAPVEVGEEEDVGDEEHAEEDTEDYTGGFAGAEPFQRGRAGRFDHDEEG